MLNLIPLFQCKMRILKFENYWIYFLVVKNQRIMLIQVFIQVLDNKMQTVFANLGSFWTNFKET